MYLHDRIVRMLLSVAMALSLIPTLAVAGSSDNSPIDNSGEYGEGLQVEIPEVYELANIAISLTPFGKTHPYYVNTKLPYHAEVMKHFEAHKTHPFIKKIQEYHGSVDGANFLKMRASASRFSGDSIVSDRRYLTVPEEEEAQHQEVLSLAAAFAKDTKFRSFYKEHLPYYQEQVKMFKMGIPAGNCWEWMEKQFPAANEQLRIFLSPLTGWSHFALGKKGYTDIYIFGPSEYVSSKVDEGNYTMVFFTELDHRYVDEVSRQHAEEIDRAFADVSKWNRHLGYRTPQLTFSEYMTWAVFCLYASDRYEGDDFSKIKEDTVEFMVKSRGFSRFGEFTDKLLELYRNREDDETVPDLYEEILEWVRNSGS